MGSQGRFIWNELHTTDATRALAFYEKVLGFTHRSMDMGPGGAYHVIGKGGVERGGVTSILEPGARPHWLPYVFVEEADATIAKVKKAGGTVQFGPEDIPGIGRFGVIQDPTGAVFAVMTPRPSEDGR
jgi:predicted enzyme related to lactoylglutathione lyase